MPTTSLRARPGSRGFATLVRIVVLAVAASALSIIAMPADAAPETSAADKVRPQLAQQLEQKDEASFWVRFAQADLSSAARSGDWAERGKAVYDALQDAADSSQKEAVAVLDDAGATYQAFWATNAIRVDAGDQALVDQLAGLTAVQSLWPTRDYAVEEPTKGKVLKEINALEWGIANINADDVWAQYGDKGEGIVVANIDTGVQYDHPALVNQYRGNNGDGTFNHNYNWFDAAGTSPSAPSDGNGHGTHTMGTMVGDDGAGNQIGVAPGAKWIAANGCCPSDAALITSGQWMLEPTDLDGREPGREQAAERHQQLLGLEPAVERPVHGGHQHGLDGLRASSARSSNGNSGPACQTSGSPGQPDQQLLGRCLRHQQQHRRVLRPWRRPERRDQAEHLGARRQRPVQPARQHVRRLQRHVDGHTAPRGHHRPAVVGLAGPEGRRRRHPGAARRDRDRHSSTASAVAPRTTTTSSVRAGWTRWPC